MSRIAIDMKKRILITVLVVLAVLILAPVVYFAYCNMAYRGKEDSAKVAYLENHKFVINDKTLDIPQAFGKKIPTGAGRVLIFGEVHGFSPTHLIDSKLLIYLNKNRGVRTYGAEIYANDAETLNRIINADSLDVKGLKAVIHDIGKETPQIETVDCLKKWEEIYAYNRGVDEGKKIHVVGLLGKRGGNKGLYYDEVMAKSLLDFLQDTASGELVKNGCYCFVGFAHALQAPYVVKGETGPTFASLLKAHHLGVTSMVQLAINSYCFLPRVLRNMGMPITPPDEKTKLDNSNGKLSYITNIINLEKAAGNAKLAIYALNGAGTPFNHGNDLVGSKSTMSFIYPPLYALPQYSTLDYFQYVLLINGHDAPQSLLAAR